MVITILEAQVEPEKVPNLEAAFKQAVEKLEAGIVQTFLLHGSQGSEVHGRS